MFGQTIEAFKNEVENGAIDLIAMVRIEKNIVIVGNEWFDNDEKERGN